MIFSTAKMEGLCKNGNRTQLYHTPCTLTRHILAQFMYNASMRMRFSRSAIQAPRHSIAILLTVDL